MPRSVERRTLTIQLPVRITALMLVVVVRTGSELSLALCAERARRRRDGLERRRT